MQNKSSMPLRKSEKLLDQSLKDARRKWQKVLLKDVKTEIKMKKAEQLRAKLEAVEATCEIASLGKTSNL